MAGLCFNIIGENLDKTPRSTLFADGPFMGKGNRGFVKNVPEMENLDKSCILMYI